MSEQTKAAALKEVRSQIAQLKVSISNGDPDASNAAVVAIEAQLSHL